MNISYWVGFGFSVFVLAGCGGASVQAPVEASASEKAPQSQADPIQVKGLWGKIDDSIVEETFQRHFDGFLECYQYEGLDVLEEIEGTVRVYLVVSPDGSVSNDVFFEDADLGSSAVQKCLLDRIKRISFPKPIGGDQAIVRYTVPFEAPYDHPAPFDWSQQIMESVVDANMADVEKCIGGATGIGLTVYVGRGGKVVAAGGSAHSLDDYAKAECLAGLAKQWTFPDPGKTRPAKAQISF